MEFNIYVDEKNRKVIAARPYHGHTVRGYAKCDPRDKFDIEKGAELAKARCAVKIAEKRSEKAVKNWNKANYELEVAKKQIKCAGDSCDYADEQYNIAKSELETVLEKMN